MSDWIVSGPGYEGDPDNFTNRKVGKTYKFTYTSPAYRDAIERYKNDPDALARLQSIVRSFSRKHTLADDISGAFGGRFGSDLDMQQMALDSDKALADVLTDLANRNYNSEEAKANRMEAAGMNADLIGVDGASEIAGSAPDEVMPELGAESPTVSTFRSIGQNIMQVPELAMSIASGVQNLQLGQQNILGKQLSNFFGTFSGTEDVFDTLLPSVDKGDFKASDFSNFFDTVTSGLPKGVRKYLSNFSFKNSDDPQVTALFGAMLNSEKLNARRAARARGRVSDSWDIADLMSGSDWQNDLESFISSYSLKYSKYTDFFIEQEKKNRESGLSIEALENAYNDDYWRNLDGVAAAEAQNMQNKAQQAVKAYEDNENSFWNGLIHDMPKNWFGQLLTLGVLFLRANSSRGFSLPSVTSGSSYKRGNRSSAWNKSGGYSSGTDEGGSSWFSFRP